MTIFDKHPRPWSVVSFSSGSYLYDSGDIMIHPEAETNGAQAIVAAVNSEPELRAERDALRARVAELETSVGEWRGAHENACACWIADRASGSAIAKRLDARVAVLEGAIENALTATCDEFLRDLLDAALADAKTGEA